MGEIKEEEKRWRQGRERGIQIRHVTLHRGVGMQFIQGGGGGGADLS